MKTMVIAVHPNLDGESRINKALKEAAQRAGGITVRDLYAEYPDGDLDVAWEQALLAEHDRIILQFPFWWYSCPSLLKKWFDEVMTFGWAYGPGGDKLAGKECGLAVSTGSPAESYRSDGYNRYTVEELTRPFEVGLRLIGMRYLPVFAIHGAQHVTDQELGAYAEDYVRHLSMAYVHR